MNDSDYENLVTMGFLSQESREFKWLVNIVDEINPAIIIEIGSSPGSSLRFWCEIASKNNNNMIISVDLNNDREWCLTREKSNLHIVTGDSTHINTINEVETILNGRKADFLFIDGNHEYDYVKRDFENYSKFVRNGGIVGFDDFGNGDPQKFFLEIQGAKQRIHRYGYLIK